MILETRYASPEMVKIWEEDNKFHLWRLLWYKLAESQQKVGVPITDEQIKQLAAAYKQQIDYVTAEKYESKTNHDVVAHLRTLGDAAPAAAGIIHLGATSQFIVDNTDCIRIAQSLELLKSKIKNLIINIGEIALKYKSLPTLGFTHFQPAQPTTVGKRMAGWAYDLWLVYQHINNIKIKARGLKGATGTQASYLYLLNDYDSVQNLESLVMESVGFDECHLLTGQTYPRVADSLLICMLSNFAAVCQKIATDIRLLATRQEIIENFKEDQVGSSAMPYKRNPIICEKVCGISKILIGLAQPALAITAEQWLERSLDDSSARRIIIPDAFMISDAITNFMTQIFDGLFINEEAIDANMCSQLSLLITEKIMIAAVKNGIDRQQIHEKIRLIAQTYTGRDFFAQVKEIPELANINLENECAKLDLIGTSIKQVEKFYSETIENLKASPAASI